MRGQCNCGKVCFEVSTNVSKLYQCHCKLCQRQSGSTSNTATMIEDTHFKWLSGNDSITHWKKNTGFTSNFCSNCGCPVPNRLRDTSYIWVPMGAVDSSEAKVVTQICCSSKANWDVAQTDIVKLDGMPDDVESFIKSLNSSNE